MKSDNPIKVSVLIPVFNEEKYIISTLRAILSQDYPDYEVIVVNNGSTDRTAEIVREFLNNLTPTSKSVTFAFEGRKGTNYARECARQLATGSIIAQLDADCVPDKNWISIGVRHLKYKNVVAVTGPYYYYDGPLLMRTVALISQSFTYPFINTIVQLAKRGGIIIGGNAFIKAAVLAKAGGYNTNFTFYGDDVDIAQRISAFGWITYSNNMVLNTSSRRYSALGFWKVNKKYQAFFWNLVFKRNIQVQETRELNHPR
jgi:glycosyltransferase involved in cell wall biosynthesis